MLFRYAHAADAAASDIGCAMFRCHDGYTQRLRCRCAAQHDIKQTTIVTIIDMFRAQDARAAATEMRHGAAAVSVLT